jgi:hypothetical protein
MSNEQPPEITIIALIFIPAYAAAVYAFPQFVTLDSYLIVLTAILGLYGIMALYKVSKAMRAKVGVFDLFPGVVEDRFLVGFDAIFSTLPLAVLGIMPYDQYFALLTAILAGLGLLKLSAK